MAGMIDELNELQKTMESEANILKKGIEILEYWNPADNSKRNEVKQEILKLEKKISGTYKKYIILWIIMVIATAIICIKII